MKVILLEDVYKHGVAGEVVNVAPGFARNYLIPRGLAVKSSPGMLRQLENLRKRAASRRTEREQEFGKIAEQIEGVVLYFGVKASETGKLYGSVTQADIVGQLQAETGFEFDRRRVGDKPLRELGEFMVPVRLDAGLNPQVKVVIFREGDDPRLKEVVEAEEGEQVEAAVEGEELTAEFELEAEIESEADIEPEAEIEPDTAEEED